MLVLSSVAEHSAAAEAAGERGVWQQTSVWLGQGTPVSLLPAASASRTAAAVAASGDA